MTSLVSSMRGMNSDSCCLVSSSLLSSHRSSRASSSLSWMLLGKALMIASCGGRRSSFAIISLRLWFSTKMEKKEAYFHDDRLDTK
jgi:hypothetical protein